MIMSMIGLLCLGKPDFDASPFDNSGTKKEGISWTYKKCIGYAPIFAYLGKEGYLVHLELRPGSDHCQEGTEDFPGQALGYTRLMTDAPLLVRMDSGNDSLGNIKVCREGKAEYIVKRNLRHESAEMIKVMVENDKVIECERLGLIFSRVSSNEDLIKASVQKIGLELFGIILQDEAIAYHDLVAKPIADLPPYSAGLMAVRDIEANAIEVKSPIY